MRTAFDEGEQFQSQNNKPFTHSPHMASSRPVIHVLGEEHLTIQSTIHGSYDDRGATCTDPVSGDLYVYISAWFLLLLKTYVVH